MKVHNDNDDDDDDFVSRVVKSFVNLQLGNNLGQPTTTTKSKLPQVAPQVMKYVANFEGVNRNYKCELNPYTHIHTHYLCATFFLFLLSSFSFSYVRHLIASPSNCE